jgi:ABC-2 type transport system permease protein
VSVTSPLPRAKATRGLAYHARVIRVVGGVEFKVKYADSAMGYFWSVAKPLAYFAVLLVIFQRLLGGEEKHHYPIFLLVGILLFTFFVESIGQMLPSIVMRGEMLRRLSFPPILIPLSLSLSVCITFVANIVAAAVFMAAYQISPRLSWFLVLPLLLELYLLILGLGLIVATLYVRFRDIGQLWEVAAQILFFACGIMYPVGILPVRVEQIVFLNPLVQIIQDIRHALIGATGPKDVTAAAVFAGHGGRLGPILLTVAIFLGGFALFRREGRYFAERI